MLAAQPAPATTATALPPRRRAFVHNYLIDLNGSAAAVRAGYRPAGARVTASRLLKDPAVRGAISQTLAERHAVTRETLVQELAEIAFSDLGDFYKWDSKGIRPRRSATVAASTKVIAAVRQRNGEVTEVRLHDKLRALELLAKVLGLIDARR